MKIAIIAAGLALAGGLGAAAPAQAQYDGHRDGGYGSDYHGRDGYRDDRGGYGYRDRYGDRGGYGYRYHGGGPRYGYGYRRGRVICRYRHGFRRCFRAY